MQRKILTSFQSPGDVVMLTAAVCEPDSMGDAASLRRVARRYGGRFCATTHPRARPP